MTQIVIKRMPRRMEHLFQRVEDFLAVQKHQNGIGGLGLLIYIKRAGGICHCPTSVVKIDKLEDRIVLPICLHDAVKLPLRYIPGTDRPISPGVDDFSIRVDQNPLLPFGGNLQKEADFASKHR